MTIGVGFSFAPENRFLDLCEPVLAAVDYLSVLPESLVHPRDTDELRGNGFLRRLEETRERHGLPLVAHGTTLSPCGGHPLDGPRADRWLRKVAGLSQRLGFRWYTDHFGLSAPAGLNLTLPLPVPFTRGVRDATRARLDRLAEAVRAPVGLENSVFYAPFAPIEDEAPFLRDVLGDPHVLLLDVHNLWVHARDQGIDVDSWLSAAPLDRVIEVHVSGGVPAPVEWGDRRLDSHDAAVPSEVWALLDRVLARCPNLRGVTLERLEGTVAEPDVGVLLGEVARIRAAISARVLVPADMCGAVPAWPDDDAGELLLADAWSARDPAAAFRVIAASPATPPTLAACIGRLLADPTGLAITHRLIARLRFDRLLQGSVRAEAWFEGDPAGFARAFAAYADRVPPTAFLPGDEAALFEG